MPKTPKTGEQRNIEGKCFIIACSGSSSHDAIFHGKQVKVCDKHKIYNGVK